MPTIVSITGISSGQNPNLPLLPRIYNREPRIPLQIIQTPGKAPMISVNYIKRHPGCQLRVLPDWYNFKIVRIFFKSGIGGVRLIGCILSGQNLNLPLLLIICHSQSHIALSIKYRTSSGQEKYQTKPWNAYLAIFTSVRFQKTGQGRKDY